MCIDILASTLQPPSTLNISSNFSSRCHDTSHNAPTFCPARRTSRLAPLHDCNNVGAVFVRSFKIHGVSVDWWPVSTFTGVEISNLLKRFPQTSSEAAVGHANGILQLQDLILATRIGQLWCRLMISLIRVVRKCLVGTSINVSS